MQRRRKYQLNWFNITAVVMIVYFLYICGGQYRELYAIKRETQAARVKLEQMNQEHKALSDERERLTTPAYIEKLAREELGLVKPGEIPYIPAQKN